MWTSLADRLSMAGLLGTTALCRTADRMTTRIRAANGLRMALTMALRMRPVTATSRD